MSKALVEDCNTHFCRYNEYGDCTLTDIFISDGECESFSSEDEEE